MKKYQGMLAIAAIAGAALVPAVPRAANAAVVVCNHSHGFSNVAHAFRGAPADGWVTEGWDLLPVGRCLTLLAGKPAPHPYYLRIRAKPDLIAEGPQKFCILRVVDRFTYKGAGVESPKAMRECVDGDSGPKLTVHGKLVTSAAVGFFRADHDGDEESVVTFDDRGVHIRSTHRRS